MQGATLNRPGIARHHNMWTSILKNRAPLLHALRNFTENNWHARQLVSAGANWFSEERSIRL